MKTTRIALACFSLLLAACGGGDVKNTSYQPPPPGTRTVPCSAAQFTVLVKVLPPATPGAKCTAQADPESVRATHNGTVQFEWQIQGGDFATPASAGTGDGIDVGGKPQFSAREPDSKKYRWKYKAIKPPGQESHKYDVFTKLNGVDCEKLDPYIMN